MPEISAGILLYKRGKEGLEVLLVHPGGPYWVNRDDRAWSIPKGLIDKDEDAAEAACREFIEETGQDPGNDLEPLTPLKQKGGKIVKAFAVHGDLNTNKVSSNTFTMEWPPRSGKKGEFPEIDQAAWFDLKTAKTKILPGQRPLLEELENRLSKS